MINIKSVVTTCSFPLRSIGQARRYLTDEATEKVLHSFIASCLDNGNSLPCGLTDYQINRLQRIQNTAARILTKTNKFEHISLVIRSIHWLPFANRIECKILRLTLKCLNNLVPTYVKEFLVPYMPSCSLRSIDQHILMVPMARLKTYADHSCSKAALSCGIHCHSQSEGVTFRILSKYH